MVFGRIPRGIGALRVAFSGYPRQIKALVATTLVASIGRNIAFPYLAIYLTFGLTIEPGLVGIILVAGNITSLLFVFFTGSLADRIGRRTLLLISYGATVPLVFTYTFISTFAEFLTVAVMLGIAGALGDPASSAMVADLMTPERREEVYGLLYQVANVGTVAGPIIGGFLIYSRGAYDIIFLMASVLLGSSFLLALATFRETYGAAAHEFHFRKGLLQVASDRIFLIFCTLMFATSIIYAQLYGLLSIHTKYEGLPDYQFGLLFSINGLMVVLLQIPIRLWVMRIRKTTAFIVAQSLYTVGFSFFAFSKTFLQFLGGVMILTVGEIVFVPAINAFVANLAPEDKRGRYMGFSSIFFGGGSTFGTLFGFQLFGALAYPSDVWLILGVVGFLTTVGYALFSRTVRNTSIKASTQGTAFPKGL